MDSYVEALLNSKSISDFMCRLNNINIMIGSDKEIVSSLNEKIETIEKEKKVVQDEKVKLDA
ncbi:MAG TPA: hypothetical protein DDZ33_05770 [Clostridium sp.]|nr:hypothetical protein [Clostridium sp.]